MVLRLVFLQLADERQHLLAEVLDLLVVVEEAEEQQIHAEALVGDDALGDLFRGADQPRTETVVVLDEVLEGGVLPHPLAVGGGASRLLDGRAEAVDGLRVGLGDDLAEGVAGLGLGVAGDEEAVEAEARRGASGALGGGLDVSDLLGDAVEVLAVGEVPVGDASGHLPGGGGVAALEDLRVRAVRRGDRLGLQREVPDAVEVSGEFGVVLGPDGTQGPDELLGAAVALVVFQPGFAERGELVLEPAADHVDGEASVAQVVGGGAEFGEDAGVPEAGVDGGDDLQPLGGEQQGEAEGGRLVLVLGAVAGHVADLAERVVEPVVLREDGEFAVVVVTPVGALLDRAGDETTADVGNPVREAHRVGGGRSGHAVLPWTGSRRAGGAQEVRARRTRPGDRETRSGTMGTTGKPARACRAHPTGHRRTPGAREREGGADPSNLASAGTTKGAGNAAEVDVAATGQAAHIPLLSRSAAGARWITGRLRVPE